MKNGISNKALIFITLLSMSMVNHANAESENTAKQKLLVEDTIVIDTQISLYQFALSNQITTSDLIKLNPSLKSNDVLVVGTKLNLPRKLSSSSSSANENEVSALPLLSNANSTVEDKTGQELQEGLVGLVPGSKMLSANTEENLAGAAVFAGQQEWNNLSGQQIIDDIKNDAKNLATNTVVNSVNQEINQNASNFLGQFGKAQVNISLDKEGKLSNYDLQILSPFYDESESLIFSQTGIHEQGSGEDTRLIGNFGIGYRYEANEWLAGANAFIDHDFTGSNTRLGVGSEFWADNYKIAANTYTPLSSWKESDVMRDYETLIYDERPAQGFDLRGQAYLPNYPQLGASLTFEQYFGEEVDLFGIENRQKDPYGLTVGANYMPIPLVKTELTHKMGKSGADETKLDLSLNLQMGTPLDEQVNPDNVAVARSLKGSRYDMVDRNYDIVFEYQKEDFSLSLSGTSIASVDDIVNVTASVSSRSSVVKYEWFIQNYLGETLDYKINENGPNIDFIMKSTQDLYITVKVTTERGYQAISKPHLVSYRFTQSQSELTPSKAELVDFENIFNPVNIDIIQLLDGIAEKNKAVSIFTARNKDGDPIDVSEVNSVQIKWRIKGTEEFEEESEIVKFFVLPGEESSQLKIVGIADTSFISTSGTREVELFVVPIVNPELGAKTIVTFIKDESDILNLQYVKLQIWALPSEGNVYSTYGDLVSESGLINGQVIPITSQPINANAKYRAKILTYKENSSGVKDWVDVTNYFVKSMVWLYWDPFTNTEVTAVENLASLNVGEDKRTYRALEECRGSPIFFSQTNNYLFNELGWGEILANNKDKPRQSKIVTEQGLQLAVQFDFTAINEQNPKIEECIPDQQYDSEAEYAGYIMDSSNNSLVKKAIVWSNNE
ncbi:inverse autotransporter beta domain-containing protein [Thorsellia kenyensis]|uniref:Inverse autotransporter beta domain-containing protein n=1 Tax=Thorsellia kenyensis TaxID=1549888 RepID=A0ABV6CFT0_9GAMM